MTYLAQKTKGHKGGGKYRKFAPPPTYTTGGEKERVGTHGGGGGLPRRPLVARNTPLPK
jgi:hypothetical protein